MKKGMKRLVSCLLAVAMVLTTLGVNTKAASAEERTIQNYVYDGYEVDFNVTDAWDGAFNADVKIANTGDDEIRDWALTFEFAHEIQNLWNATVVEHTGDTYVIKNADWNANIKPGEAVAFGMTVLCDGEIAFPENFSFVTEEESVIAQSYSAEFTLYSDWGTGCNGAIILSNLTDEPIDNWQLEFDYDREIVDIANAVIVSYEQGHYVIKNAEYNADIAANSSAHISIVAGEGAAEERPENFTMQQTVVGDSPTGEDNGKEEIPDDEMDVVIEERLKGVKYKEPEAEHMQYDDASDTYYVDNQLALIVKDGVTKEQVENYAKELEASVVGYIVVTGDYQIEFDTAKSWDELHALMEKISGYDWVEEVLLQELYEIDICASPDDPAWYVSDNTQEAWMNEWDENFPAGNNWGLEAINARSAWEYEGETVKVGIIDTIFDEKHEDLVFVKTWENVSDVDKLYQEGQKVRNEVKRTSHGTHVAGTIGAIYNNNIGITGVAKNVDLYAVAMNSDNGNKLGTELKFKYALANLIICECKVINVSMSLEVNNLENQAKLFEDFLMKFLRLGYDFVIVQAAGNEGRDASSSGLFVNIDADELRDRILVVGSVELKQPIEVSDYYYMQKYIKSDNGKMFGGYRYWSDSNYGKRVDVCAPGVSIYSTLPGNKYSNIFWKNEVWQGTSMAAPHVSGVAAMCYSVNPKLSGVQVKEILCDNVNRYVRRNENERYPLVNAQKAVEKAKDTRGEMPDLEPDINGTILGYIYEYNGVAPNIPNNSEITAKDVNVYLYEINNKSGTLGKLVDDVFLQRTGEFSFVVPEGNYCIIVYSNEYVPTMYTNVNVKEGQVEIVKMSVYKTKLTGESMCSLDGIVSDAVSGNILSDVKIYIYSGLVKKIEDMEVSEREALLVGGTKTNEEGKYTYELPVGYYTLLFEKEGYINNSVHVVCLGNGEEIQNVIKQNIVLSPLLAEGECRIVLTWGKVPGDLDAHIEVYRDEEQEFHVYFANRFYCENNILKVQLDLDARTSYGPETITIILDEDEKNIYRYYIRDYTNGMMSKPIALSLSDATVVVFFNNRKVEELRISPNQYGKQWNVLEIVNGELKIIDTVE